MPLKGEQTWMHCTLCRSGRQSMTTLNKALTRRVEWPTTSDAAAFYSAEELRLHTTIDEAFDTVLQYMNLTSRQCKRFFRCQTPDQCKLQDVDHCKRFHYSDHQAYTLKHPLQRTEDVQVEVAPGSYAITAGHWGAQRGQTHIVRLENGQTADLAFTLQ